MDLKEAASRLGVHYQTAYQWVRDGRLGAQKIGASYDISPEEIDRLSKERSRPSSPPQTTVVRDWDAQRARLYESLLSGDESSARSQIQRLYDGKVSVVDICGELFAPVLREIGTLWRDGAISIAQEHRASSIIERCLSPMMQNPPGRPKGVAVVATPPGEEHSLPSIMAAAVLRQNRWITHYLGTEVPLGDLVELSRSVKANVIVVSNTLPAVAIDAEEYASNLESLGFRVILGRPGASLAELTEAI